MGVKTAISEQRKRMRLYHFESLENVLRGETFKANINKLGGAKARIWKLLTDGTNSEEEARAEQIMALFRTPEYVHEAFFNAPLDEFYEEAMTQSIEAHRRYGLMKADIVVFARWVELKVLEKNDETNILSEFWNLNKYSFSELYDRVLDDEAAVTNAESNSEENSADNKMIQIYCDDKASTNFEPSDAECPMDKMSNSDSLSNEPVEKIKVEPLIGEESVDNMKQINYDDKASTHLEVSDAECPMDKMSNSDSLSNEPVEKIKVEPLIGEESVDNMKQINYDDKASTHLEVSDAECPMDKMSNSDSLSNEPVEKIKVEPLIGEEPVDKMKQTNYDDKALTHLEVSDAECPMDKMSNSDSLSNEPVEKIKVEPLIGKESVNKKQINSDDKTSTHKWKTLKEFELSKEFTLDQLNELLQKLHLLLKQIVGIMDGFFAENCENLREEIRQIKNQLHLRKFAMAVVRSKPRPQLFKVRVVKMLLAIIETKNGEEEEAKKVFEE
uniref:Uncharacterized protein n=1 Tax=Globodera rostochiensis TaxID=31243 RepID=A0A914H1U8_GLORO